MAQIITCITEKGGVGKTSILFNTSWELSKKKKILMIDLDGQEANLTYFCGVKKTDNMKTMFNVLVTGTELKDTIVNVKENLDLIPAKAEVSSLPENSSPGKFLKQLNTVTDNYDYIFIDVSPTPNKSHFIALCVSDSVIIPMLPDGASLKALNGIAESISEVKFANRNLKVLGILYNRNEGRTNLSREVKEITEKVAAELETTTFNTGIRQAVVLGENVMMHEGITDYAPKHPAADDYRSFIKEMEERINE